MQVSKKMKMKVSLRSTRFLGIAMLVAHFIQ